MKPSEILREANRLLQKHGWTTGNWQRSDGGMCVEGAIGVAAKESSNLSEPLHWADESREALRQFTNVGCFRFERARGDRGAYGAYSLNDLFYSRENKGRHGVPTVLLQDLSKAARQLEKVGR